MKVQIKNIKNIIRRNWRYHLIHRIIEEDYGHKISREIGASVNKKGEPIPWFTYPALEFLCQFNLKNYRVFEWGSGNSSLYFSNNCLQTTSVEHDLSWFNKQSKIKQENQTIILANEKEYPTAIHQTDTMYDIIVIDGILRDQCAKHTIQHITKEGVIIFDNAERHPLACSMLRKNGFTQIDFHGLGPINEYAWTTSFFFKHFLWQPLSVQPKIPLGGGF